MLAAGLLASSCILDQPSPDLGECAEPPEGRVSWEFGEVGIGTCIASPADLRVRPDPLDPDNHFVVLANSNARTNFVGSSLLSIDASSIDLTCRENGMHELDAFALPMQQFAGRFDFDDNTGLALLSNRHSGGFEGALTDAVLVVDASDPRHLRYSDLGPRQTGPFRWLRVPADPWSVRIDPASGRAWVLALTSHLVSGVDLTSEPLSFIDLRGERSVGDAEFEDVDGSGSAPDFELLGINDDRLQDETVTLTFVAGTTRLYYPADDGLGGAALFSTDSGNGVDFVDTAGGPVLHGTVDWAAGGLGAAAVARIGDALDGLVAGEDPDGRESIGRILASDHALDWAMAASPVLEPTDGWDSAGVRDPDFVRDADDGIFHAWFAGGDPLASSIGHARGSALTSLSRDGNGALDGGPDGVVLAPDPAGWDAVALSAPSSIRHGDTGEWLLYYAGHADDLAGPGDVPVGLAIGLARSDDAVVYAREDRGALGDSRVLLPGDPGEWDSEGVTAPSVLFANGRFQMWYQGFDGADWQTGRATSVDGRTWTKDPRNPVYDGVVDSDGLPLRAFAYRASPGGYYRVAGDISDVLPSPAFEGPVYESTISPVFFQVVGGQALGRGEAGTLDASGAGSPADAGTGLVLYAGHRGTTRRLAASRDAGAGLVRAGAVTLEGFAGDLADLVGDEPSLNLGGVNVLDVPGEDPVVGFHAADSIALASGPLDPAAIAWTLTAVSSDPVLERGEPGEFDDVAVRSPSLLLDDGAGKRLMYYEGRDDSTRGVGLASSDDGLTWTREGEVLGRGSAGAWDDAWVGMPTVVFDGDQFHLWYVGSDGDRARMGYATSPDGRAWTRYTDSSGVSVPVFDGGSLPFAEDEVFEPSARLLPDGDGFEMFFEGSTGGTRRIGRARSVDGVTWTPVTNPTTAGDRFTMTTRAGDTDASSSIELGDDRSSPRIVDGFPVHGAGASEMILSPDGHHALVANKRSGDLVVLDLHDDSDGDYVDANYGDIEGVLRVSQVHGMVGLRDMEFDADGRLWTLMAPLVSPASPSDVARVGTEALVRLDWSLIVGEDGTKDVAEPIVFTENVVDTWLPVARGIEEDQGYFTEVSVGPSAMELSADGSRAYVVNFNDNSLYVFDLDAGARGALVAVVDTLDENPWEVALSPDGRLAYVANYYGVGDVPVQHSTVQVVDVDETSDTFGEVLTRLTNVGSRSDHGCP